MIRMKILEKIKGLHLFIECVQGTMNEKGKH